MSQKVISLIGFVSLFLLILALPVWALVEIDPFNAAEDSPENIFINSTPTPSMPVDDAPGAATE